MNLQLRQIFTFAGILAGLTGLPVSAWATADEDPFGGPPDQALVDPAIDQIDISTTTNTVQFAPVLPRSMREPAMPVQRQPRGALAGRIVYTSPGHGWLYSSTNGWYSERYLYNRMVESFGNHDQFTYYCYYLFNAGATVVPLRPVGNQTNVVILDNDDSQVTFSGSWSNSSGQPYYGQASDAVSYRFAVTGPTETATATYRPNIPAPGFYPIYTWVLASSNRAADQLYRIHHSGGISEVTIDHRKVGNGWVYLGSYYLEAGTGAFVEISNQTGGPSATNVIADAIRFGNGMGTYNGGGGVSGYPREDEGSVYWIRGSVGVGGPSSAYTNGNVGAPPRMAAHMNNSGVGAMTDRVYIGIHSNGGNGSNRGALGLYNTASSRKTPNQAALADIFGRELNVDLQNLGSPPLVEPWSGRNTHSLDRSDIDFGEIRWDTIGNEMDATIIETAFHDNVEDAAIMRDPYGRQVIARSMLHATIKYFKQFGGGQAIFPPNVPTHIKTRSNGNGTVTVSWNAPAHDPTGSGLPAEYVVYRSSNGYGFGNPVVVTGATETTLSDLPPGEVVYFRVASSNSAGESFPSETVAVRMASFSTNPVLIVNGFDRLDAAQNIVETTYLGEYERVKPWRSNNFDYVVPHAKALAAARRYFDSSSNEALTAGVLSNYQGLVWIAGEESTADETFSNSEQSMVTGFLNQGKALFVSGAEIGWDLEVKTGGVSFYNDMLLTDYVSDDAATYNVNAGQGIFSDLPAFNFGPDAPLHNTVYPPAGFAFYDADYPDTINPINGSSRVLSYSGGAGAAVAGNVSGRKVVSFGFPFENITDEDARNGLMEASMAFMGIGTTGVADWAIY